MVSKRKPSVELLRIIACFVVVSLHATEDIIDISANNIFDFFIYLFLQNGVTIFWIITGFFIFNSNYKDLLNKTFKKVWLPTFVVSIVCVIAYDYYLNVTTGVKFKSIFSYLIAFIYNALRFRTFAPSCRHFWFIYTYCLLVIFYPILKSFVDYLDSDKKRQRIFVFISLVIMFINEITLNEFLCVVNHGLSAVMMASIEVILGHILYENKDYIINRINSITLLLLLFIMANIVICLIYILLIKNSIMSSIIVPWYSISNIIVSGLLFIICERIIDNSKNSKINILISKIGVLTFGVYIFHKIPIKIFNKLGVVQIINNSSICFRCLLIFVYFIICFSITLLISFIYNKILDLIYKNKKC